MTLSGTRLDNLGLRVLLSSKEMSKGCISYNLGRVNLVSRDLLSTGVNFYYSLYHSCVSVISSTSTEIPIDLCVAEWKKRAQLPRYYVPLTHSKVKNLIAKLDTGLANELNKLLKIREYLSYGPNVLYELDEKRELSRIRIYTCKFKDLSKEIGSFNTNLPNLISCCAELLRARRDEGNFFFFLFQSYMTTDIVCKDLGLKQDFIDKCWSTMDAFDEKGGIRRMVLKAAKAAQATRAR